MLGLVAGAEVAKATTTQEWILTGAAIISAGGTFGAVFTALFFIPWKERRRRPRLSVTFDGASEFDFMVGVPTQGRGCSHWVLPRVHNEAGKDSAINVEVVFIEMRNVATNEPLQFENRCLEWSGVGGTQLTVAPGLYRHTTLLFLMDPKAPIASDGTEGCQAHVVVKPDPGGDRSLLSEGQYRARFAVTASNAETVAYEIDVSYDGTWWQGEEIRDHLVISEPRRVKL